MRAFLPLFIVLTSNFALASNNFYEGVFRTFNCTLVNAFGVAQLTLDPTQRNATARVGMTSMKYKSFYGLSTFGAPHWLNKREKVSEVHLRPEKPFRGYQRIVFDSPLQLGKQTVTGTLLFMDYAGPVLDMATPASLCLAALTSTIPEIPIAHVRCEVDLLQELSYRN